LAVLALAIALESVLPSRLTAAPSWVLPAVGAVLLVRLITASPFRITGANRARRRVSLIATALVALSNGIALGLLCHLLFRAQPINGKQLILAGGQIWLTNVLLFSVWYWELDRGGPGLRAAGEDGVPDFLYPQMSEGGVLAGWRPQFVDYLYVSLTNATAFSPTDTMPLSSSAKLIMGAQSLISLITIGLVVARAVNIL
jgi:uncharacterized membrane protein